MLMERQKQVIGMDGRGPVSRLDAYQPGRHRGARVGEGPRRASADARASKSRRFQRRDQPSLSVGVVGLGYWGPNLLRGLVEQPGVDVSYVCDLDEERVSITSRRYPAAIPTTRYQDLLGDPTLDAVVIATPVFTHFELAASALHAGKHTFVEKPLAPSAAEARELMELAVDRDLRLMCGQTFLY